jgi:flagellar protein FliS
MDHRLRYLETRINSASPGELLIMLYDGLVHHAEEASRLLAAKDGSQDRQRAADSVRRCIDILTELNTSLNHSVDPALCATLSDLYRFYAREFSEALEKTEPARIDAILPLILDLRNAWEEAGRLASLPQPQAA